MPEILGAISIVISLISLAVLLGVVKKIKDISGGGDTGENIREINIKIEQLTKSTAGEFQRNRSDNMGFQKDLRDELDKKVGDIANKFNEITKGNYEHQLQLSRLLTNSLDAIREKNIEQNEKQSKLVEQAIGKMQQSNEAKLEEMRKTVDEKLSATLSTRLDSSFKTVSEQLEKLYKSLGEMKELSTGVTDNVTALNRVLTNVKARGTWAEVQLEGILDQTVPNMYEKNYQSPGRADRVEFAIKIPDSNDSSKITYLPLDSKFPMEDYIRLCSAADSADAELVAKCRKALESNIYNSAKNITKYINLPHTTNFAIMYLATEGLYAEVISSKTGLPEKIQNELNIMIAGPTTITALLNSLAMGFRSVAINEKANEIRLLLGAAKQQYDVFGELLGKAKKRIDDAGKTLDEAERRNSLIQKKLRSVEALDSADAANILAN